MITAAINYTDFIYRPRRPEEPDTGQGGGVVFSQAAHQVDIVRLLAGTRAKRVRAVTGSWNASRPTEGAYAALLTFQGRAFATLICSGYGHFDSDELQEWIGEMGRKKRPGEHRGRQFASASEEAAFKRATSYGGVNYRPQACAPAAHQNFGTVIVSCEHGDVRPLPSGVMIYRKGEIYRNGEARSMHFLHRAFPAPRSSMSCIMPPRMALRRVTMHVGR